ncbi:MAG: S-layer homology domain-containing protein, partial [Actinomycetota bacterium]
GSTFRALLVFAVLAAGLATATSTTPAGAASPFDDVPAGVWYSDAVEWLADSGITTGTSPNTFSPGDPVTRAQMAAFIARFLQSEGDPGAHGFSDVPAGSYYDAAVTLLAERGITTGTSATTYSPGDPVTRAQMATFLWRLEGEPVATTDDPFTDNPAGTFYYEAVRWLVEAGITTGTSATTYSPGNIVNRAQMATFLWRLAGEPLVGEAGINRIDPDETLVVDEDEVTFETLNADGESTIEWDGEELPDVGDIVVMDVTDETPDAFLGKVVEVDGDVVVTEPAVLEETMDEGNFETDIPLDPNGDATLQLQALFDDAFKGLAQACGAAGGDEFSAEAEFSASAGFSVEPGLTLSGRWHWRDGLQASIAFYVDLSAEARALATTEVECSRSFDGGKPIKLPKIKFLVGAVPVWISPEISFGGTITANFQGKAGARWTWEDRVGVTVSYDSERSRKWQQDWDGLGDGTIDVDPLCLDDDGELDLNDTSCPMFEAEATLELELEARLDMLAYGRGGPYAALRPFFELGAQNSDPWWWLDAGVRAGVGASFDTWFWKGEVEFAEFELARWRLADASTDPDANEQTQPITFEPVNAAVTSDVSASGGHTCVIIHGEVGCVGSNQYGRLGDGTVQARTSVVMLGKPLGSDGEPLQAVDVEVGNDDSCARYEDGSVRCWGRNELGNVIPVPGEKRTPTLVDLPGRAIEIYAPSSHQTCALIETFELVCWGWVYNDDYITQQFIEPVYTGTAYNKPYVVDGLGPVVDAAIGDVHACAAIADGTVWCWGNPFNDVLDTGSGTFVDGELLYRLQLEPIRIRDFDDAIAVEDTCAIHANATITCWSDADPYGLLAGVVDAKALSFGAATCLIRLDDSLSCFGNNSADAVGDTNTATVTTWLSNPDFGAFDEDGDTRGVVGVTAGEFSTTCVQLETHRTLCWGANGNGQLGNGESGDNLTSQTTVIFEGPPLP